MRKIAAAEVQKTIFESQLLNPNMLLSNLIEEYLKSVSSKEGKTKDLKLSPITKSLFGSVKSKDKNFDYKKIMEDEILKKHL